MIPDIRGSTPPELVRTLNRAIALWRVIPNLPAGTTSHSLCRAFRPYLKGTEVRDGYFAGSPHSWLIYSEHPQWALEIYPWSQLPGSPVLVSLDVTSPWAKLYQPPDIWLQQAITNGERLIGYHDSCKALEEAYVLTKR